MLVINTKNLGDLFSNNEGQIFVILSEFFPSFPPHFWGIFHYIIEQHVTCPGAFVKLFDFVDYYYIFFINLPDVRDDFDLFSGGT